MIELFYILIASLAISFTALAVTIIISMKEKVLNQIILLLVSLSAGAMIGGAFLHLLPEAMEHSEEINIFTVALVGFILFSFIEKGLHMHHCHRGDKHTHTFHYMALIGAGVHSFIDGLIISAGFIVDLSLGATTAIIIATHEIPKKIGDFGVLVHGGFERKKAILVNFLVSFGVVLGGLSGYILSKNIEQATMYLLPISAGGFIYVASVDLLPELSREKDFRKSIMIFEVFMIGILLMWLLRVLAHH